jgi:hypothetical protein
MRPDWTKLKHEQRLVAIKAAMAPGKTAEEIALAFINATRGSIIGFCNRNKIDLPNKRRKGPKPRPKKKPAPPKTKAIRVPLAKPVAPPKPVGPEPIRPQLPSPSTAIPFSVASDRRLCMWPLWGSDVSVGDCCGAPRVEGGSYCEHHAARSVGRGTESERTADRVLERYA